MAESQVQNYTLSSSCREIRISASQVASAIGCHPYKTKEETLNKIWKQFDPRTFFIGNALEHEEEVVEIVNEYWKRATGQTKYDLSQILFEDWDKQELTLVQLLKELFPEYGSTRKSLTLLREEVQDLVLLETDSDYRNDRELDRAQVNPEINLEISKLVADPKRPVSTSVKEICEKKDIKKDETKKIIQGFLNKKRGIQLEQKSITDYEKQIKVKVQVVPEFKRSMEYDGVSWIMQGQIDGKYVKNEKDRVVEVKNRTVRYMRPEYDIIQLQTYMFLCQKSEGILLECLKNRQRETVVPFKEEDWNDRITPALKDVVVKVKSQIEPYQTLINSCSELDFTSNQDDEVCIEEDESTDTDTSTDMKEGMDGH